VRLRPYHAPLATHPYRTQLEWFEEAGWSTHSWPGWDLDIFLDMHNAGHRHRQERFRAQQVSRCLEA